MAESTKKLTLPEIQSLLGRALTDADFRAKLVGNPAATLKRLGYDVAKETDVVDFFKKLKGGTFDSAAKDVQKAYSERLVDGIIRPRHGG